MTTSAFDVANQWFEYYPQQDRAILNLLGKQTIFGLDATSPLVQKSTFTTGQLLDEIESSERRGLSLPEHVGRMSVFHVTHNPYEDAKTEEDLQMVAVGTLLEDHKNKTPYGVMVTIPLMNRIIHGAMGKTGKAPKYIGSEERWKIEVTYG